MRGWMNAGRSYVPPVGIGEVMRALGVAEVVARTTRTSAVGDTVIGIFGVQEYATRDGPRRHQGRRPTLAPLTGVPQRPRHAVG